MKTIRGLKMKMWHILIILCVFAFSWIGNAYKLINSDFDSPLRAEFFHGVGLVIPPISIITVWVSEEKSTE